LSHGKNRQKKIRSLWLQASVIFYASQKCKGITEKVLLAKQGLSTACNCAW
jgi:hypothetical protein